MIPMLYMKGKKMRYSKGRIGRVVEFLGETTIYSTNKHLYTFKYINGRGNACGMALDAEECEKCIFPFAE